LEAPTKNIDSESAESNLQLFKADAQAVFVRRPNRFLIIARITEILQRDETDLRTNAGLVGEEVACRCPNPGRLLEFVIPGTELLLERRREIVRGSTGSDAQVIDGPPTGAGSNLRGPESLGREGSRGPKTRWTAVAVRYRDAIVPLFSARANGVVREAVLPEMFPDAQRIQAEYTLGDSRFDFMVQDKQGITHLIEVKACSLVEAGVAMFPDAPSERAVKHIEELAELSTRGYRCHILFVIVHGNPEQFIPNLHTDPEFASALSTASNAIQVHAVTLKADETGLGHIINMNVPVNLSFGSLAAANRGSYLVVLEVPQAVQIDVGSLGTVSFVAGWYVYAGSAQKKLAQRLQRHARHLRKNLHWHLDYLTAHAGKIIGFPIASFDNLECELAAGLRNSGGEPVPRFGSSDCGCESHLFYFPGPPLKNRAFLDLLFYSRHRRALGL